MCIIKFIKDNYPDKIIKHCKESGCELSLVGIRNHIMLKGEKLSNEMVCDCIIFKKNNTLVIGLVELKSKTLHVRDIYKKLVNGAKIATSILSKYKKAIEEIKLIPVVLHKSIDPMETRELGQKKYTIKHGGQNLYIRSRKCGTRFSELIRSI